jgi:hypothetical protein
MVHLGRIGVSCCRKRRRGGHASDQDLEKAGLAAGRPPSAAVELGKEVANRWVGVWCIGVKHHHRQFWPPAGDHLQPSSWAGKLRCAQGAAEGCIGQLALLHLIVGDAALPREVLGGISGHASPSCHAVSGTGRLWLLCQQTVPRDCALLLTIVCCCCCRPYMNKGRFGSNKSRPDQDPQQSVASTYLQGPNI